MCGQTLTANLVRDHVFSLSATIYTTRIVTPLHTPWKPRRWQITTPSYNIYKGRPNSQSEAAFSVCHSPSPRPPDSDPCTGKDAMAGVLLCFLKECCCFTAQTSLCSRGGCEPTQPVLFLHRKPISSLVPGAVTWQPTPPAPPRADGCLQGHLSPGSFLISQEPSVITAITLTLNKTEQNQDFKGAGEKQTYVQAHINTQIKAHRHIQANA